MPDKTTIDPDDDAIRAHLIPTGRGAEYAAGSNRKDPRRDIIWGLLRNTANHPLPLSLLREWGGVRGKREILTLLFRLQREGLLNGDKEPFTLANGPFDVLLSTYLDALGGDKTTVLANAQGLPVMFRGCTSAQARHLALVAATLSPLVRTTGRDGSESALERIIPSIRDSAGNELVVQLIYIKHLLLFLVLAREAADRKEEYFAGFVQLMALLGRRYLGAHPGPDKRGRD